jgi:hypothetical protein
MNTATVQHTVLVAQAGIRAAMDITNTGPERGRTLTQEETRDG